MKNVDYKVSVRIRNETLRMINYITEYSGRKKSTVIREVLELHILKYYQELKKMEAR